MIQSEGTIFDYFGFSQSVLQQHLSPPENIARIFLSLQNSNDIVAWIANNIDINSDRITFFL